MGPPKRLNKTVLSRVCFETECADRVMHTGSVAGHSRHMVRRLQNCMRVMVKGMMLA